MRVLEIYTNLCACLCLLVEQLRWKVPYAFSQSHSFHRRCRNTSTAAWRWDKRNLSFVECSTCLSPYCQVESVLVYGRTHANTLKLWCAKFFAPFLSRQVMLSHALCMYTKGLQLKSISVFYHANPSPSATNISHRRCLVPLFFPYFQQFLIIIYFLFMLSCDMFFAQRLKGRKAKVLSAFSTSTQPKSQHAILGRNLPSSLGQGVPIRLQHEPIKGKVSQSIRIGFPESEEKERK